MSELPTETERRFINVILTTEEKNEKGEKAASLQGEIDELQEEEEGVREELKKLKGEVSLREAAIHKALKCIAEGTEHREELCEVYRDFAEKKVSYFYREEVVDSRPMTPEELQRDLFDEKAKDEVNGTGV